MNKGKVYLIGAGPGDVGLFTLKGRAAIEKADVVVYDRLANPRLLQFAKPGTEFIYVGKTPDHHTLNQDEINELLAKLANEGKNVARLKGGDPFVFGRGGEEAERLVQDDILFDIIPGITSSIAVPAYAGIPVTHRNLTSSFTVVTGHEDPTKDDSQINWQRLAEDPGTLIFLMGVGRLPQILEMLSKYGKSGDTPIALIQWGTRPEQKVVVGNFDNILMRVEENGLTSPAIIIIGDVVRMREKLQWFENRPLFGQRVLVTRAREQASALSEKIEELGGEVLEAPMIRVAPVQDTSEMDETLKQLESFDWMIFTSVNGVRYFFEALKAAKKDIRDLQGIKICAIGPKTRERLENMGLLVEAMPDVYHAEAVAEMFGKITDKPHRILIPRSSLGREVLVTELEKLGHDVCDLVCYETVAEDMDGVSVRERLAAGEINAITFTSSSTVTNFMKVIDRDISLINNVRLVSIGPITSQTARDVGLKIDVEANQFTIDGLVEALVRSV